MAKLKKMFLGNELSRWCCCSDVDAGRRFLQGPRREHLWARQEFPGGEVGFTFVAKYLYKFFDGVDWRLLPKKFISSGLKRGHDSMSYWQLPIRQYEKSHQLNQVDSESGNGHECI